MRNIAVTGAYNVVGDGSDSLPSIARATGLQIVEVPQEMVVQGVTTAWKEGLSTIGPQWAESEGSTLCSNEKLKATGA